MSKRFIFFIFILFLYLFLRDPTDGLSGYRKWMDGYLFLLAIMALQNQTEKCQYIWLPSIVYQDVSVQKLLLILSPDNSFC